MRKTILISLSFLSLLVIFIRWTFDPLTKALGYSDIAGIKITATPDAAVYLDGKSLGRTPLENDNLSTGEYLLKLESNNGNWEGKVSLNRGTITLVNRDLAQSIASSSGEILTLIPGVGVVVTSNPDGASLSIDGKEMGTTPLSLSTLSPGEHDFVLSKNGFLKRDVRAKLPGETALHLDVDLAVSEADLGNVSTAVETTVNTSQALVKNTPTGFLRVRSQPSLSGSQLTLIKPGTRVTILSNSGSWSKIKLKDGIIGYVASTYLSLQQ